MWDLACCRDWRWPPWTTSADDQHLVETLLYGLLHSGICGTLQKAKVLVRQARAGPAVEEGSV